MLHFLAAVALLIFIGERIVHYLREWKLRRDVRRHLPLLQRPPKPPWIKSERSAAAVVAIMAVAVVGVVLLRMG